MIVIIIIFLKKIHIHTIKMLWHFLWGHLIDLPHPNGELALRIDTYLTVTHRQIEIPHVFICFRH